MPRKKKTLFFDDKQGFRNVRAGLTQAGKECSGIATYGAREFTGQSHRKKTPAKPKKGWFE